MQVTLGSTITVEHPSIELVAWCKENLTITNPEYAQKMRMHLWLGNTPRYLALYPVVGCIGDKGIYTIVAEDNGWGKLKSGAGWISLAYTKRV